MPLTSDQVQQVNSFSNVPIFSQPGDATTVARMNANASFDQYGQAGRPGYAGGQTPTGVAPPQQVAPQPGGATDDQIRAFYAQHQGDPGALLQAINYYGIDPARVQQLTGWSPGGGGVGAATPQARPGQAQSPQSAGGDPMTRVKDYFTQNPDALQYFDQQTGQRYSPTWSGSNNPDDPNGRGQIVGYSSDGRAKDQAWTPGTQYSMYDAAGKQTGTGTEENPYSDSMTERIAKLGIGAMTMAAGAGAMGYGPLAATGVQGLPAGADLSAMYDIGPGLGVDAGAGLEVANTAQEAFRLSEISAQNAGYPDLFPPNSPQELFRQSEITQQNAGYPEGGLPPGAPPGSQAPSVPPNPNVPPVTPPGGSSPFKIGGSTLLPALTAAVPAISSAIAGNKANSTAKDLAADLAAKSDPFAKYREGYGKKLADLEANPSSITNTPGWQAGLTAVERKMASQGYNNSGNMAGALAEYGESFFGKEAARLATLAGAGQTPGAGLTDAAGLISQGQASQQYGMNAGLTAALQLLSSLGNS